jgi:hypothetical protein
MIRKYNEFLFESMILESIVVYSDKFRKILDDIDSPVAKSLKDIETKDLDIANNYLDINDKDTISFITDRKAKEIIQQSEKFATFNGGTNGSGFLKHSPANNIIFGLLGYEPVGEKTYHPNPGEKGEVLSKAKSPRSENIYVKIKFTGGLSVVNENYIKYIDPSKLPFQQNRQTIRTGRGVKAILSKSDFKFSDADIEQFVNKYKSAWDKMNDIYRKFELVSGDKISYWYSHLNYESQRGTLGSSCMKGVNPSFFDIYVKNPDKCSLLILKADDESKIKARALVWKLDNPQVTFMDRIYSNNDSDVDLFKQYAHKENWYHKPNQDSSDNYVIIGKEGRKDEGHLVINLKNSNEVDYRKYPYLDTLKSFNRDSGQLTTECDSGSNYITLEDTGGGWAEAESCDNCGGEGRVDCYECGGDGEIPCTNCSNGRYRRSTGKVDCEKCEGNGKVDCEKCDGKGEKDGKTCDDCEGSGCYTCDDCDGDGKKECSECEGTGNNQCDNCGGGGRVDCPECS